MPFWTLRDVVVEIEIFLFHKHGALWKFTDVFESLVCFVTTNAEKWLMLTRNWWRTFLCSNISSFSATQENPQTYRHSSQRLLFFFFHWKSLHLSRVCEKERGREWVRERGYTCLRGEIGTSLIMLSLSVFIPSSSLNTQSSDLDFNPENPTY